jgi:hypothetical protein
MISQKPYFLVFIEYLTKGLELRLVDYQNGGFLPPEKRALQLQAQGRIGKLVGKMARFKILDDQPLLRAKLLIMATVLRNEYPELNPAYFSTEYKPKQG